MRHLRRVGQHVGRRGAYLLFLAQVDAIVAYTLTQPLPLGISQHLAYQPFTDIAPLAVWTWVWAAVGALLLIGAFVRRIQPIVFAAASLIKVTWASGYIVGWMAGYPLFSRGYYSAAFFVGFAAVTLIVSGWRENGT